MAKTRVRCPRCGEASGVPILRGFPDNGAFARAERGEVALGGCMVTERDPEWHCMNPECLLEWADIQLTEATPRSTPHPPRA